MCTIFFEFVFWSGLAVVFYAYLGYGILLYLLVQWRRRGRSSLPKTPLETTHLPQVTFVVCAYNEEEWIVSKVNNTLALDYPSNRILFVFVTDGSSDATPERARSAFRAAGWPEHQWEVLHQPERQGKIAAFHRAVTLLTEQNRAGEIVVSTDANTLLNPEAVRRMVRHFADPQVGAVAGEKRIHVGERAEASSAGEGIYWRYESLLKKWDAELWSVVGAAGELFAFRTEAYEAVPPDTLVEDFYLTMRIAQHGYRVAYEPDAYASETSSASVGEELKRKVRIAAGGLQAVVRLAPLLNVFRYGTLSFQYISHRVLRWTLAPIFLPILLVVNVLLAREGVLFYQITLAAQVLFYVAALLGYVLEQRQMKVKILFVPYYFCVMNYAMYAGFLRLLRGRQTVLWERAERKTV